MRIWYSHQGNILCFIVLCLADMFPRKTKRKRLQHAKYRTKQSSQVLDLATFSCHCFLGGTLLKSTICADLLCYVIAKIKIQNTQSI